LEKDFKRTPCINQVLSRWNYLPEKGEPSTELKGRTPSKNMYQEVEPTYMKWRTWYRSFQENPKTFQGQFITFLDSIQSLGKM
jgi:hypothetical protein